MDPRYTQSYHHQHLSVFRKVMALKTFEYKFIAFLQAPMDQDGVDNLISHQQWVLKSMLGDPRLYDVNLEDLLSRGKSFPLMAAVARITRIQSLLA